MPRLRYAGQDIPVTAGQVLLDALLAAGISTPFSCRAGACQACMVKVKHGDIPQAAQAGLRSTLAAQGFALACRLQIVTDLDVVPAGQHNRFAARITEKTHLTPDICRLRIDHPAGFDCRPGQYLTLWKESAIGRSYSIANLPEADDFIELHVRILPDGIVSNWVARDLSPGASIQISGAAGSCHYLPEMNSRPLLLAGTGTGLAPLAGILRDAHFRQHSGRIVLLHGASTTTDLYLDAELHELTKQNPQFEYHGIISGISGTGNSLPERVLRTANELESPLVFLCGNPGFVHDIRRKLFIAGTSMADIHADAFLPGLVGKPY